MNNLGMLSHRHNGRLLWSAWQHCSGLMFSLTAFSQTLAECSPLAIVLGRASSLWGAGADDSLPALYSATDARPLPGCACFRLPAVRHSACIHWLTFFRTAVKIAGVGIGHPGLGQFSSLCGDTGGRTLEGKAQRYWI